MTENATNRQAFHALVLRNYVSDASKRLAIDLAAALFDERYGRIRIDWNRPEDWPEVFPDGDISNVYAEFKRRVREVEFVIPIFSAEIESVDLRPKPRGVVLLSEMLFFWDQDDPTLTAKLVPVLLDCEVKDLKARPGSYEQLQDIVVPLLEKAKPIRFSSQSLNDRSAWRAFVDEVARRLEVRI